MTSDLQVVVGGTYVESLMPWGDLEWSTVWPGGSDALSFGVARSHKIFRPGALVELYDGGECLWCGTLLDPTRGAPLVAEGLFRKGEDYSALVGAGDAATSINGAVDAAIEFRGLPWIRDVTADLSPSLGPLILMPALDPDTIHSLTQFLDAAAQERLTQWGVLPNRQVVYRSWGDPTLHMLPGMDGLGVTHDGYACLLFARYLDSTSGLFATVIAHDEAAEERWGYAESTVTEPLGEGVAMTEARAQELVNGLLAQGRSQIGWTSPIEVQYGDVVNEYAEAVDLHKITAGQTIRLHGLVEDIADLAGQTWTDVAITRVTHKDGIATIEPRGLSSPMNDVLSGKS